MIYKNVEISYHAPTVKSPSRHQTVLFTMMHGLVGGAGADTKEGAVGAAKAKIDNLPEAIRKNVERHARQAAKAK